LSRRGDTAGRLRSVAVLALALLLAGGYALHASASSPDLVVYCAHDSLYAEAVIQRFRDETGLRVAVRYDTEATKSLGLVEQIERERDHRRCDVLWTNEPLGAMQLAAAGLLQPYRGDNHDRIPAEFRDPHDRWCGFAARLRVWIVNGDRMHADDAALAAALRGDLSRTAIAAPRFGTTRAHYTALWQREGAGALQAWHRDWRARGVVEVGGNAAVKNAVANGTCWFGLTDTDDFFAARDGGAPVAMLPFRFADGATLCLPNVVAILAGTDRLDTARRFTDFLLGEATELQLANCPARQLPLGPVPEERLPADVRQLRALAERRYPVLALDAAREPCLQWLRGEQPQ
jgi:iron(III) transport system substrate-binding protein